MKGNGFFFFSWCLLLTAVIRSLQRVMNRPSGMENSKKIEECCDNMAASTEHPSDRYIRSFILTQTFINTIYVNYGELGEAAYEESLVKIMIGAKLREFESLKATLEEDLSKCPSPLSTLLFSGKLFKCSCKLT